MAFLLIAHRSGPGAFPEQSIASARHALQSGADMVEMDIMYTLDGEPVICHDANALRMFGMDRLIQDMTLSEFMSLRHQADQSYPTHALSDVLACGLEPILFHFKVSGERLKDTVQRIISQEYGEKAVLGVLKPEDAQVIRSIAPHIRILSFMKREAMLHDFLDTDVDIIRLWEEWVTPDKVAAIHERQKQVFIMAGSSQKKTTGRTAPENLRRWRDMGADGVLIDDVAWARRVLQSL